MPMRPNFYYNNPYAKQISDNLSAAIFGTPELEAIKLENQKRQLDIDNAYEANLERGRQQGYEEEFWRRYAEAAGGAGDDPTSMLGTILADPGVLGMAVQAGLVDPKDVMTTEQRMRGDDLRLEGVLDRNEATRYGHDVRADAMRDVADIRGQWGHAIQGRRNEGNLAVQDRRNAGNLDVQGLRNEGALATQGLRNEGALATTQARATKGNLPLDVDEKAAQGINEMVLAMANRELSGDPEEYRVLVEGQADIEARAAELYQQTRNMPMSVAMAWSEVMGYEPQVVEDRNWFSPNRATVAPSKARAPVAPAAAAGTRPPSSAPGQPVVVSTPQERDALPPGTPYIAAQDPTKTVRVRQ